MAGIVESIIMDGLPVRGERPMTMRIPSDKQLFRNRPHKMHGHGRSNVGTNCRRTRKVVDMKTHCIADGLSYAAEASRLENAAIERARFDFFGRRALVCKCDNELVGFAVVHRGSPKNYLVWHAYSPITGEFSPCGEVIPNRVHGLNDNDVRELAGYYAEDTVSIRKL